MRQEKPVRATRTYQQHLHALPDQVFPLLCPLREREWVEGWDPLAIYSYSGVAEPDCVFITPEDKREAIWVITTHDPIHHVVEFVKVIPGLTAARIRIVLEEKRSDSTEATVTYRYTALSEEGVVAVEQFTEDAYEAFMTGWETALNEYLLNDRQAKRQDSHNRSS